MRNIIWTGATTVAIGYPVEECLIIGKCVCVQVLGTLKYLGQWVGSSCTMYITKDLHWQRAFTCKWCIASHEWMNSLGHQLQLSIFSLQYFTKHLNPKYVFSFPSKAFVGVRNVLTKPQHPGGPPAHWPDFLLLCYNITLWPEQLLLGWAGMFSNWISECLLGRDGPKWIQSCSRRGCCWLWICQGSVSGKLWVRKSTFASNSSS